MADDPTKHAIDVVAHQVIAHAAERPSWEEYPEIGELDWFRVQARVKVIVNGLEYPDEAYRAAYEHLKHRANEPEAQDA